MSNTEEMVQKNLIYKCIHGSTAYGLNTTDSDVDIKGIFIPNKEYYYGTKTIEQQEYGPDCVIYALKKFITLASDCNPNIIEVLFCDDKDILFINDFGRALRNFRHLFISKKAKHTFSGYAYAQLQRIKGHQKWINNPQIEPKKEDFFVVKKQELGNGKFRSYEKFLEVEYDLAYKKYCQYLDWKKNRNPKRAELEEKFGFDCKHGMHLIRLLRMGKEILSTGQVIVKRPDREELLAIRNGAWSYDKLIEEAEKMNLEIEELYNISTLPKSPDKDLIDKLLIAITEEFLKSC